MVTLLVFINIQEKMDAVIVATIQSQYEQTIFSIALSGTKHSKCRAPKPNSIIVRYYNAFLSVFTKTELGIKKITALVVDKYNFFV